MGLDLYVEDEPYRLDHPRWSYSGFMVFRTRLAAEIGIDLRAMEGFGEPGAGGAEDVVSWGAVPPDNLHLLLNHSDSDGDLTPEECAQVAPRLEEVVSRWPAGDYDREKGLQLAAFMRRAAATGKKLVFA